MNARSAARLRRTVGPPATRKALAEHPGTLSITLPLQICKHLFDLWYTGVLLHGRPLGKGIMFSPRKNQPITLSLFSGAGGLDIGFHLAGFHIVACVEKEPVFCDTLRSNVGRFFDERCQILSRDIRDLDPSEINNQQIDFIIGGPPCQSFSAIGRRAGGAEGIRNERGSLFEHYCRFVKHFQPKGFVFENVRGILGSNKGEDWKRIISAFSDLGYRLFYRILDTADYDVPQHRERLLMVGLREGDFSFPRPTRGSNSSTNTPHMTALEAIEDLQDPTEICHIYPGKHGKLLAEVPPGMNYHYFTREMGYPHPVFAWRSRFSDFLYKADPHKPVRTIVAQLGAYSGPFHWKNRKFTFPEFKRLQSFPDDYLFSGSNNIALKQLGNSVPPVFANHIALAVRQQVFQSDLGVELLGLEEKLSFDSRKSNKAKTTRRKRLSQEVLMLPLFDITKETVEREDTKELITYIYYDSIKKVVRTPLQSYHVGPSYKEVIRRTNRKCTIDVFDLVFPTSNNNKPSITYTINFRHTVGNGLEEIECSLYSTKGDDVFVAWDSIESYIQANTSYQTMFDIYGHFTEPHPIFDLQADVSDHSTHPAIQFAKRFSTRESTSKVLPAIALKAIFANDGESNQDDFDFTKTVRYLRRLRFDIRVNETNPSIPPNYFRCCYPFTISLHRQVSVAWKDKE